MTILFNDVVQKSDAPTDLVSPALDDFFAVNGQIEITFEEGVLISAIGIAGTDGTVFNIRIGYLSDLVTNNDDYIITNEGKKIGALGWAYFRVSFIGSGLYLLGRVIRAVKIIIETDASFIGRIGAGIGINIGTSVAKQPGWNTTSRPRTTMGGQVILGAGGYNFRTLHLDSRYELDKTAVAELIAGYKYIGLGYPYFIDLAEEKYKLPYSKLYAIERNQRTIAMEGGVTRFIYSKRFEFQEAF